MHVHHDCNHELNPSGDGLGLNNIKSMFDWCVLLISMKIDLRRQLYDETSQDTILFSQELL